MVRAVKNEIKEIGGLLTPKILFYLASIVWVSSAVIYTWWEGLEITRDYVYFTGQSIGNMFVVGCVFKLAKEDDFKMVVHTVFTFSWTYAIKDIWFDATISEPFEALALTVAFIYVLWKLRVGKRESN